jgi:hypothetical protein
VIPDPVFVLASLVLAHFVADFVLQTDRMAIDKGADGRRAVEGMLAHTAMVALCLAPVVLAFGGPGAIFLLIVAVSHGLIDRTKVLWTRRADAAAADAAEVATATGSDGQAVTVGGLGPAWTPIPGALFILDQAVHLAVTVVFWAILLVGRPLTEPFADALEYLFSRYDAAVLRDVALWVVVWGSLLIVNIRGASFFVTTLVTPRNGVAATPPVATNPDRVGETIGALERLLIVIFVLARAEIAVGLVVAAKTIARFRQLDDRAFAEYYLLGTLASVSVAVVSGLAAAAALGV